MEKDERVGVECAADVEHGERATRRERQERLRREQRLRSARDFQRVRAQGRRISGQLLSLTYARRPETGVGVTPTRVGFSVGKRVGGAVVRNRVKRRLRESIRRQLSQFECGWDIIISAYPRAAQADFTALDTELRHLCGRARLPQARAAARDPRDRGAQ